MYLYDTSYLMNALRSGEEISGAILDLTVHEVTNVLKKAVSKNEITQEDALNVLRYLSVLNLKIIRIDIEDSQKILIIADKYGLTAYDAAYVYYAVVKQMHLRTMDKKMTRAYEEIKKKGYI